MSQAESRRRFIVKHVIFSSLCFLTSFSKIKCVYFYYPQWARIKEAIYCRYYLFWKLVHPPLTSLKHWLSLALEVKHLIQRTSEDPSVFRFEKMRFRKAIYLTEVTWLLNDSHPDLLITHSMLFRVFWPCIRQQL